MSFRPVGDFVKLQQGLAINKKSNHLVYRDKHPDDAYSLLRIQDMCAYKKGNVYIDKKVGKQFIACEDNIIYTRTGQPGLAFRGFKGVVHNNCFVVKVVSNDIDTDFLYQMISSDFFKNQVFHKINSSIQKDINHGLFESTLIPYCDKSIQREIGTKLTNIDNKIIINRKIINTLHKKMKDAFIYTFFDFSNISTDQLELNKELDRAIPKGWKRFFVSDLVDSISESVSEKVNGDMIDLSFMLQDSILIDELNTAENFKTNIKKMNKGDFLFGSIRAYQKKSLISPIDGYTTGTVIQFRPKYKNINNFLLCLFTCDSFFKYAVNNSTGTKMPVISDELLLKYEFASNFDAIYSFDKKYNYCDLIINLLNENITLNKMKKELLNNFISDISNL